MYDEDHRVTMSHQTVHTSQLTFILSYLSDLHMHTHTSRTRTRTHSAAKATLIRKWRGRLQWAPKEVDVFRQILVSTVPHTVRIRGDLMIRLYKTFLFLSKVDVLCCNPPSLPSLSVLSCFSFRFISSFLDPPLPQPYYRLSVP